MGALNYVHVYGYILFFLPLCMYNIIIDLAMLVWPNPQVLLTILCRINIGRQVSIQDEPLAANFLDKMKSRVSANLPTPWCYLICLLHQISWPVILFLSHKGSDVMWLDIWIPPSQDMLHHALMFEPHADNTSAPPPCTQLYVHVCSMSCSVCRGLQVGLGTRAELKFTHADVTDLQSMANSVVLCLSDFCNQTKLHTVLNQLANLCRQSCDGVRGGRVVLV